MSETRIVRVLSNAKVDVTDTVTAIIPAKGRPWHANLNGSVSIHFMVAEPQMDYAGITFISPNAGPQTLGDSVTIRENTFTIGDTYHGILFDPTTDHIAAQSLYNILLATDLGDLTVFPYRGYNFVDIGGYDQLPGQVSVYSSSLPFPTVYAADFSPIITSDAPLWNESNDSLLLAVAANERIALVGDDVGSVWVREIKEGSRAGVLRFPAPGNAEFVPNTQRGNINTTDICYMRGDVAGPFRVIGDVDLHLKVAPSNALFTGSVTFSDVATDGTSLTLNPNFSTFTFGADDPPFGTLETGATARESAANLFQHLKQWTERMGPDPYHTFSLDGATVNFSAYPGFTATVYDPDNVLTLEQQLINQITTGDFYLSVNNQPPIIAGGDYETIQVLGRDTGSVWVSRVLLSS